MGGEHATPPKRTGLPLTLQLAQMIEPRSVATEALLRSSAAGDFWGTKLLDCVVLVEVAILKFAGFDLGGKMSKSTIVGARA